MRGAPGPRRRVQLRIRRSFDATERSEQDPRTEEAAAAAEADEGERSEGRAEVRAGAGWPEQLRDPGFLLTATESSDCVPFWALY